MVAVEVKVRNFGAQIEVEDAMKVETSDAPAELLPDETVAAVVTDEKGRVTAATPAAAELLGFSVSKLVGRRLRDLADNSWEGAVENALDRIDSGSSDAFEVLMVGRSGRRSLIRMVPRPASQPGGTRRPVLFWRRLSFTTPPQQQSETGSRRLTYALLRRHDQQRDEIARELQHDVASLITLAKITAENAARHIQRGALRDAAPLLLSTSERLRDTLVTVRRISTQLMPSSLDDLGFVATVEWLARQLRESNPDLRIEIQVEMEERLIGRALKVDLYRIIEEALLNVVRHAHASRVRVALVVTGKQIQLSVEDNGVGFDAGARQRADLSGEGSGLHGIGSRVDATHGSLYIESTPGSGTSVVATWPLDEASVG